MLLVDGAVANVVDGDIHEFTSARAHDDVLYTSCQNCIFVLSLCELFGIASHSRENGPKIAERLIFLQSVAIETFAARGKMDE